MWNIYTKLKLAIKYKCRTETIKHKTEENRKILKTIKPKWQTEKQGQRNSGDIEQSKSNINGNTKSLSLSIITLNLNGLISLIKRQKVTGCGLKQRFDYMLLSGDISGFQRQT